MKKTLFALAAGLAVLGVSLVACGGSDSDDDLDTFGEPIITEEASSRAPADEGMAAAPGEPASGGDVAADAAGGAAESIVDEAPALDRKVVTVSELGLEVQDIPGMFQTVKNRARAAGGYVEASRLDFDADDEGQSRATYAFVTVRVPAAQHDAFLDGLRAEDSVHVTSETTDAQEVTAEYHDLESELRNLRSIEAQYLVLLEKAATIDEILTVTDRLNTVRADIERVQGRINLLADLSALATVTVTLRPPLTLLPDLDIEEEARTVTSVFSDAWESSWGVAENVIFGGIVVLVAAVWLLPLVLIVLSAWWLARRRHGRRRATAAGDSGLPPAGVA